METVVLSLGGSLVSPAGGVDIAFIKKFCSFLRRQRGYRFALVVGGGRPARDYQEAARSLKVKHADDLDLIGIAATRLNAEIVRACLGKDAYDSVLTDPTKVPSTTKRFLVGCGWKPGWSTDFVSVTLPKTLGASRVLNLSNVEYVYDKDPRKYKNAQRFEHLSWSEYRAIVGSKWTPGLNAPFDPVGARAAQKYGVAVFVADGKNVLNTKRILEGRSFKGTIIA